MTKLSLREAAKTFDVSRPTLTKALKLGKISGEQDSAGGWKIDHSELLRVYQPRQHDRAKGSQNIPANFTSMHLPLSGEVERLQAALSLAEARAEAAERLAQERAERIADLRRMLPTPETAPQSKQRGWWEWLKK